MMALVTGFGSLRRRDRSGFSRSYATWRERFRTSVHSLLTKHPRLAGVHINIEPLRSGDPDFLER
jgi:hypothetical protein